MDNLLLFAYLLAELVVCFLLGSIPWGVIISRAFFKKDIRDEGSGNIGATNAMRSMGKKGGVPVFILDFAKGLLAGLVGWLVAGHIAFHLGADPRDALGIAILGCTLGHIFSPWLKFKGGKGISVAFGCSFFAFGPIGALIILLFFIIAVIISRRISVGSIVGAITFMVLGVLNAGPFFGETSICWIALVCYELAPLVVIWAHRANIKRLIAGEEPRIGSSRKEDSE